MLDLHKGMKSTRTTWINVKNYFKFDKLDENGKFLERN